MQIQFDSFVCDPMTDSEVDVIVTAECDGDWFALLYDADDCEILQVVDARTGFALDLDHIGEGNHAELLNDAWKAYAIQMAEIEAADWQERAFS